MNARLEAQRAMTADLADASPLRGPVRTLRAMRAGDAATIVGVSTISASAKRLADMGFVSGARIDMVRPGNPCIVRLGGTAIGLGRRHQECILIAGTPDADSPAADPSRNGDRPR